MLVTPVSAPEAQRGLSEAGQQARGAGFVDRVAKLGGGAAGARGQHARRARRQRACARRRLQLAQEQLRAMTWSRAR